jgi:hypothetical protein
MGMKRALQLGLGGTGTGVGWTNIPQPYAHFRKQGTLALGPARHFPFGIHGGGVFHHSA